jgi:peptidoglycan/LPS O-acetylase OafA/YrhL
MNARNYRPEIDGLRAVAVLVVLLYHAGMPGFSGGFVGVDVFFVISGFLITRIILTEIESGKFSYRSFYERRIRRILPPLLLVSVLTIPVAVLTMYPDQLIDYAKSLIATQLFVANVHFLLSSGYFQTASELKPLLHFWSLAVEEQFYFVVPALLMLAVRFGRRWVFGLLWVIVLFSFVLADWMSTRQPDVAFFVLPTRGWELGIGALVSVHFGRIDTAAMRFPRIAVICGGIGLVMIAVSVPILSEITPFPGRFTLIPVIGTALVIGFSRPTVGSGRLLSSPLMVSIGLVSYSAYLWHQPLFVFARLQLGGEAPLSLLLVLVFVAFVFAALSWRWVEMPFRDRQRMPLKLLLAWVLAAAAVCVLAATFILARAGFADGYPPWQRDVVAISAAESTEYTDSPEYAEALARSFEAKASGRRVLIIGDSFSQDLFNMIRANHAFSDDQIAAIQVPARCGASFGGDDAEATISPRYLSLCRDAWKQLRTDVRIDEADIILVAFFWNRRRLESSIAAIQTLNSRSNAVLRVIGSKDFVRDREILLQDSLTDSVELRVRPRDSALAVNRLLSEAIGDEIFLDPLAVLCEKDQCPAFDQSGRLITYDGRHLTPAGALFLGHRLLSTPQLSGLSPL